MENLRIENAALLLKPQTWDRLTDSKAPITMCTSKINCSGPSKDHYSTLASESFLFWNKKKPCRKMRVFCFYHLETLSPFEQVSPCFPILLFFECIQTCHSLPGTAVLLIELKLGPTSSMQIIHVWGLVNVSPPISLGLVSYKKLLREAQCASWTCQPQPSYFILLI